MKKQGNEKTDLQPGMRPENFKLYKLGESARWLRMDHRTLKKLVEKEKIPAIKAGEQTYRILGENLLRFAGSATISLLKPDEK